MLNMKNKLAKRIMAFVLSGAMVISGLAPSGMTAYAAEASTEIATENVEESFEETEENEEKAVSGETTEETPSEDSGADAKEESTTKTADKEVSKQEATEDVAPTSEIVKDDTESSVKPDTDVVEETTTVEDAEEEETTEVDKENKENTSFSLDMADATEASIAASGSITVGKFIIKGNKSKASDIVAGTAKIGEKSFTKKVKMGGSGEIAYNSIHFVTEGAGTVKVYVQYGKSGQTASKYIGLYKYTEGTADKNGTIVGDKQEVPTSNENVALTFNITEAGNYYIGGEGGGSHIYGVDFIAEGDSPTPPVTTETHTVWMVGDSTVSSFNDKTYYYPRYGYGTQLQNYLDDSYKVKNIAASGRSSKSYLQDNKAEYDDMVANIKEGDVLIIGFGHNDAKQGEDNRFTDPTGSYTDAGSFAESLYTNYVQVAIDAKAIPIVCTPIVRRTKDTPTEDNKDVTDESTETYDNSPNVHVTTDKTVGGKEYKGGSYPDAAKSLASIKDVYVVDLTTLTKDHWVSLGNAETRYLHSWTSEKKRSIDNTHLNLYGAKVVAQMLAKQIKTQEGLKDLDIAQHINQEKIDEQLNKDTELENARNKNYRGSAGYTSPETGGTLGSAYGIFERSAFGDIGGTPTDTNFTFGVDENYDMHMAVTGNKGKLSAAATGIAMYYYRIPATSKFSLEATAKVKSIAANKEAGFGLMARDNMYIDTNDAYIIGDYVVAGTIGTGDASCFYNKDSQLKLGTPKITAPTTDSTYKLKITKTEDGYACSIDDTTQSGGYDFPLMTIDDEYQYIGMFVARNADVVFSDIKLVVEGQEVDIQKPTSGDPNPPGPTPGEGEDQTQDGDGGNVNVLNGLKAGNKYGFKNVATFEVLEDMNFLTQSASNPDEKYALNVDGVDYTGCVQGSTGGADSHSVQASGTAAFEIKAITDSKITFTIRQTNRNLYFVDKADMNHAKQDVKLTDSTGVIGINRTFYMKEGHTYQFYAGKSKVMVANISIAKSGKDDPAWSALFGSGENPENPESGVEGSSGSGATEPGASQPGTSEPGSSQPGTSEPGASQPGTTEPDASQPGTSEPDASQPGTSEPGPSEPGASEPGTSEEYPDTPSTKIPADSKRQTISLTDKEKITIEAANVVYTKKQPYAITVTYTYESDKKDAEGKPYTYQQQLTENLHYKVTGTDLTTVGEKEVTIEGTGKKTDLGVFVDSVTVKYNVIDKNDKSKKNISKEKLTLDNAEIKQIAVYKNDYITPQVKGLDKLGDKANYKVVYKNNINAGKASVTIIGQNEYYGVKELPFTIKKADLSKTDLLIESANTSKIEKSNKVYKAMAKTTDGSFIYQGSPITINRLKITLKDGEKTGKTLREREDYAITYRKNAQAGTASVTIKGANNFSGSIKIEYNIKTDDENVKTALSAFGSKENPLDAEYSEKGAKLTEIPVPDGTILKENKDYKVTYSKESKAKTIKIGDTFEISITGTGSYKSVIQKNTKVWIKVVPGKYHVKEGTIIDTKKITAKNGSIDPVKLINAAKITDASGRKVKTKPAEVTVDYSNPRAIKVTPTATDGKYVETTLPSSCRIAEKLSGIKLDKLDKIANQPFDGVNSVTLTEKRIQKYLNNKITADDIRIVSYKNNNKLGSATVTIEGKETGKYYGTRNIPFKITVNTASDRNPEDEETSPGSSSSEEKPSEPSSGSGENPSEPSSGDGENSSEPTSGDGENSSEPTSGENSSEPLSSEESSETEGSSGDTPTPPEVSGKLIDVWDFGVKDETDTKVYRNHVTSALWDASEKLGSDGKFTDSGEITFGNLTVNFAKGDRVYKASGSTAGADKKTKFSDYTSEGHYYCGGSGGSSRRYITIDNVSAGDKIYVYVAMNNASSINEGEFEKLHFDYQGSDGEQKDERMVKEATKLSFMANYSGTYKIWTSEDAATTTDKGPGKGGKPNYCRVVRIPAVEVAGNIDKGKLESLEGVTLKFINNDTGAETPATITGTTYRVTLAGGYTYTAMLSGATGYGFTRETKNITVSDSDAATGKSWNLAIEKKETYKCSGSITGFAEGYDTTKLVVKFKTENDTVPVPLTGLNFSDVDLEPNEDYTVILEGVNDYEVKSGSPISNSESEPKTVEITVGLKDTQPVNGGFIDVDRKKLASNTVTGLVFKNVDDEYEYTATVNADSYTVNLRDGAYIAEVTAENYKTTTHVVVEGGMVSKNLLLVSTATPSELERKADVYVDQNATAEGTYKSVNAALKDIRRMKAPEKEEERITIHIAPGTYREQIRVNVPYVSFVNTDPSKEVKLTWYYGIGYEYYSANSSGYYDEERAYDKYKKNEGIAKDKDGMYNVNNWGTTVQIESSDFRAENIVFENSFNRYLTDEELEDGVAPIIPTDKNAKKPVREIGLDVKSKPATERAAAMYIESKGNRAEFYKCSFLSSQDTLGTGKPGTQAYFKECFIEGNTDYICGNGDCVFDNCVLNFAGYSDTGSGGYITAAQDSPYGYLFWGCTVTGSASPMKVDPGYFGRPWRQAAKVAFVNTKLDIATRIHEAGWTNMGGATVAAAGFKEYNTIALDGGTIPYDDKNIRKSKVVTENPINAENPITAYFGENWTPKYYVAEAEGAATSIDGNVVIGTDGDLSSLTPNCTLWVTYALAGADAKNDASEIKWYRCKSGEDDVLITTQSATASKNYVVQKADVGYTIKAVVTPKTTGGKTGEAKEATSNAINDGWYVPEGKNPELGDGVNIFLAGDSTVKDYSPDGMYSKGEDKGSWGEYLQSFFDEEQVKIVNYANGGRSSRSFINEGSLAKIEENIGKGDYLFIQFGHNDCSNDEGYLPDRYVSVGVPDENGIYPTTKGEKSSTESLDQKLKDQYGSEYYAYDTGTFKWYLQQYIDVAVAKDATPVLVTPVARMYYDKAGGGTIREHHDATKDTAGTVKSSGNAYVKAVVQLAEENQKAGNNVLLIDAFTFTKGMYEDAWKADNTASGERCAIAEQLMAKDDGKDTGVDSTHCNKLGGFITAAYIADAIKTYKTSDNKSLNIASAIKAPSMVIGQTLAKDTVFRVNGKSELTANDWKNDYVQSNYWTTEGQKLIDKFLTN